MNDRRTYDQLGAALRAMPYESRELLITTTYLMAAELAMTFGWPIVAVDVDGVADKIVGKLAERFDAIAAQALDDELSPSRLLDMLNRANAAEAKAAVALDTVRHLVHEHLLGDDVATNQLGKAFLAALAIAR